MNRMARTAEEQLVSARGVVLAVLDRIATPVIVGAVVVFRVVFCIIISMSNPILGYQRAIVFVWFLCPLETILPFAWFRCCCCCCCCVAVLLVLVLVFVLICVITIFNFATGLNLSFIIVDCVFYFQNDDAMNVSDFTE